MNTNQLAQNNESSEESKSNQLLIDTLLLGKENLHQGGFLLNNEKGSKHSKWSFGTKFSPFYSTSENLSASNNVPQSSEVRSITKNEKPNTGIDEKSWRL